MSREDPKRDMGCAHGTVRLSIHGVSSGRDVSHPSIKTFMPVCPLDMSDSFKARQTAQNYNNIFGSKAPKSSMPTP